MTPQTHQKFVDNTLLMGHPSVQEAQSFKKSMNLFVKASGLDVNPNKSQVFFLNTALATQRNIIHILGFSKGSMLSKYLGIPLGVGKLKKTSWQELLDKMKQKLSSSVFRPLNFPNRLILVKTVIQAMPIYLFSVLLAPKSILKEIRKWNFFWGGREVKAKFSLVCWEEIYRPKEQGGLGLRDLEVMAEIQGENVWW